MNWQQAVPVTPNIPDIPGDCLVYVRQVFGVQQATGKYPTAISNWNASRQHRDSSFPSGCAVPIWFTVAGNPAGHVAVQMADGSVYSDSSPTGSTPVHLASIAALESYYSGRLTYKGWSEDVEDTLVIKEDILPNSGDVINVYQRINHKAPTQDEINTYISKSWSAPDGLYYGKVDIDLQNKDRDIESKAILIAQLEAQIAAGTPPADVTKLTPGFYEV